MDQNKHALKKTLTSVKGRLSSIQNEKIKNTNRDIHVGKQVLVSKPFHLSKYHTAYINRPSIQKGDRGATIN